MRKGYVMVDSPTWERIVNVYTEIMLASIQTRKSSRKGKGKSYHVGKTKT